ncbi:MAG: hypothetical protein A2268_14290 [Candidatus Raymondbacteria bacterium RifOxyA12_full_50_37]|uniref:tRNA/rRNA methyltransferase SpoU type domain-containing protein n=1 Tax=Candidatus Raymondbacteria bacterium RIFOXYD12_FULL_49_13 TaxID=1817890 RepID=A0A1F7FKP0_UNCRA|nr:MAG: hypothetical protein A2268_14290 [Candidatus Raymondbacteria bacterium RifOxyA12_full_50_37]OGJ86928.1 MAG: hypothetical protein A2350_02205 [Candidatus Raymondbacteria bacterium RifOxyB12_full_50_8]OGJ88249.1 MAG: hypothetical protein A2248_19630 [Candidatus Raymondbacteria bacterium RIFOXYA2_FULL_49_16]OGK05751.1 MAG: hypothetical protein A2487_19600 [Candidatus Raymondbacteria bacterium RifOxyC12_full_50_8]OGK07294.1 MAG: hypothetical protein A2519_14300 [Candidatus Raymondbacteria b
MRLHFILVEPEVPENIGSCARALNTMGFGSLRLVNPACDHLDARACALAHGSESVLKKAKVFKSLGAALEDLDFIIGATNRTRTLRHEYYSSTQVARILEDKGESVNDAGIVFGPEQRGLSNEDLRECDLLSRIPLFRRQPSLNLAQAVLLYAYEFSRFTIGRKERRMRQADPDELKMFMQKTDELFRGLGIEPSGNLYRRAMERLAALTHYDMRIAYSIISFIKR